MSVQLELERTFLASHLPPQLDGAISEVIIDTYIPEDVDHATLRLRKKGELYELTKKVPLSGDDSSQMSEHTVPLSVEEYTAFKKLSNKTVSKRRFHCTFYGRPAEVDVFLEGLDGLVLIDFEFESVEAMQAFRPPEVCLAEVTQDAVSAGGRLAGKTFEDIIYDLQKYNYQPLFTDKQERV